MDWRRVLLWMGLVAVVAGSVVLIGRVSIMAFGSLVRDDRGRQAAPEKPPSTEDRSAPSRAR